MVYLSFNGEVVGQFEESAVPGLLAEGKVTDGAFYWREGMAEWRPIAELPKPEVPKPTPAVEPKPAISLPSPVSDPAPKKTFLPRRTVTAGAGSSPSPLAAEKKAPQDARPMPAPVESGSVAAPRGAMRAAVPAGIAPTAKKRRGLLVGVGALFLLAALGAGAWWWFSNLEPPVVPGNVVLVGDEDGAVEIRIFRRSDLAAPWRERLAAADTRAKELEALLTEAQAGLREKSLLRDEAARVCEVGEEYNMPDVEELRADRDAKQAEADAAQTQLQKLESEKAGLLSFESLLESLPAPLRTMVADPTGAFSLPPPEEDVVLLATASTMAGGKRATRAWLELVELPGDGEEFAAVRFSETNRLDLDQIRKFASAEAP